MRYSKIVGHPRPWNQETPLIITQTEIAAEDISEFKLLVADETQVWVFGHDEPDHRRIVVHASCTSADAKRRIENRRARS